MFIRTLLQNWGTNCFSDFLHTGPVISLVSLPWSTSAPLPTPAMLFPSWHCPGLLLPPLPHRPCHFPRVIALVSFCTLLLPRPSPSSAQPTPCILGETDYLRVRFLLRAGTAGGTGTGPLWPARQQGCVHRWCAVAWFRCVDRGHMASPQSLDRWLAAD